MEDGDAEVPDLQDLQDLPTLEELQAEPLEDGDVDAENVLGVSSDVEDDVSGDGDDDLADLADLLDFNEDSTQSTPKFARAF